MFTKIAQETTKQFFKDSFIQGVIETVRSFEKEAEFQKWMEKESFQKAFTDKIIGLVTKVKAQPSK